ncbi:hypothetical protein OU995_08875 [Roseateles sp. SL47]|jgi:hypothetical protein|uniref:hypothetical protein n=1 Tax=Roseateles sp. SL47 TaxID=2995138 RepID=UPI00226FDE49|nr:hypothetical protein [Roseateles sp. SL47]WAC74793.1 hypothetical protein OU995_08875 [Roseateles sp. SL47]
MTTRIMPATVLALLTTVLCSACVFAPTPGADTVEITKMSEQASATCGAGNVKEVSRKSFTCK